MSSRDFLAPASPTLTFTCEQKHTLTFLWVPGIQLISMFFQGKNFTHWGISPVPVKCFDRRFQALVTGHHITPAHIKESNFFFLFGLFSPLKIENGGGWVLPLVVGSLTNNRWYLLDSNFTNHLPYLPTKSLFYFDEYSSTANEWIIKIVFL